MEERDKKPQKKDKEGNSDFGLPKATFKPVERIEKSYRGLKIFIITIGVIFLLGGVYYWIFRNSPDKVDYLTSEELEAYNSSPEVTFFDDHLTTKEDVATEKSDFGVQEDESDIGDNSKMPMEGGLEEARVLSLPADNEGAITEIRAPQGIYFVVVGSFVDSDMALDYASQLAKQGVHVMFIEPNEKKYFFRVAVDQGSTFYEANDKATALKSLYGEEVWVLKY